MRKGIAALLAAILMITALSGCNTVLLVKDLADLAAAQSQTETFVSYDRQYRLTAPGTWVSATGELSADASLEIANTRQEMYVLLIVEDKDYFVDSFTLKDYAEVVLEMMVDSMEDAELRHTGAIQVHGLSGQSAELRGVVEHLKFAYWVDFLETDTAFLQVVGWTLQGMASENQQTIQEVMRSLELS